MGTRADFYVGIGADAEWLGSIAFDGYPEGIEDAVLLAEREEQYRDAVAKSFEEDATTPDMGWPWPWRDSNGTDYAYTFHGGRVLASAFGSPLFVASEADAAWDEEEEEYRGELLPDWPDMSDRQNVTLEERSGLIVLPRPKN